MADYTELAAQVRAVGEGVNYEASLILDAAADAIETLEANSERLGAAITDALDERDDYLAGFGEWEAKALRLRHALQRVLPFASNWTIHTPDREHVRREAIAAARAALGIGETKETP